MIIIIIIIEEYCYGHSEEQSVLALQLLRKMKMKLLLFQVLRLIVLIIDTIPTTAFLEAIKSCSQDFPRSNWTICWWTRKSASKRQSSLLQWYVARMSYRCISFRIPLSLLHLHHHSHHHRRRYELLFHYQKLNYFDFMGSWMKVIYFFMDYVIIISHCQFYLNFVIHLHCYYNYYSNHFQFLDIYGIYSSLSNHIIWGISSK